MSIRMTCINIFEIFNLNLRLTRKMNDALTKSRVNVVFLVNLQISC